jgi:hypothetical protein
MKSLNRQAKALIFIVGYFCTKYADLNIGNLNNV